MQLDFATVFSNLKTYIDHFNDRQEKLTDRINSNSRATIELIVRLYLKQLSKVKENGITEDNLPGFLTFNTSLARCKGCSKRTIINHKERLHRAGLIIKEVRNGKQGILVWINPKILFNHATYQDSQTYHKEKYGHISSVISSIVKNFHPLVHEQHEQLNTNSNVHKSPHYLKMAKTFENFTKGKKNNKWENLNEASSKKESQKENDLGFYKKMVWEFWTYAQKILYPDLYFSGPEHLEVLNLIWKSVYGNFKEPIGREQWVAYHRSSLCRLNMVRQWLEKDNNRWIPAPHFFFDVANKKNGFKNTWEWYVRRETLRLTLRNHQLLKKVKKDFAGENNKKGYQAWSRLQLYRMHESRLKQLNDGSLMHAYYMTVQQIIKARL